jgi:hypothetical protein
MDGKTQEDVTLAVTATAGVDSEELKEGTLTNPSFSSLSLALLPSHAAHPHIQRDMIRQSVTAKLQSLVLTESEQIFLDHVLEHGTNGELEAVNANLSNTNLFLSSSTNCVGGGTLVGNGDATSPDLQVERTTTDELMEHDKTSQQQPQQQQQQHLGSIKRQEYLASRRNCCTAAKATWERATMKIIAAQRMSGGYHSKVLNKMEQDGDKLDINDDNVSHPSLNWPKKARSNHNNTLLVSNRSTGSFASTISVPESSLPSISEDDNDHDGRQVEKNDSGNDTQQWSLREEKKSPEEEKEEEEEEQEDHYETEELANTRSKSTHSRTTTVSSSSGQNRKTCVTTTSSSTPNRVNLRSELIKTASVSMYHGEGFEVGHADSFDLYETVMEHYDPWMFETMDEDGHARLDVHILGTSRDDTEAIPHVLSPMLMHSLQQYLPYSQRGESFWLKYSLVRDGASTLSFLPRLRASKYTLLACETVDGEVFGFFATQPWVVQPTYFGTGESFVWKMKHSRILRDGEQYHNGTLLEQAQREAEIDVYPAVHHTENRFFQLCQHNRVAIGGGGAGSTPQDFGRGSVPEIYQPDEIGFALIFDDGTLLHGSSSACMTFHSPPLSKFHGRLSFYC